MLLYIDPGTGSLLAITIMILLGLVVVAAFVLGAVIGRSRARRNAVPPAPTSWEDLPPPQPHR